MVIHNIAMEEDDDIEALRLAALQTIRPRITSKKPMPGMGHHRHMEKGPFIRPVNNPNLIAIVPTELPLVEPSKPIPRSEKNNKVIIDVIEDLAIKEKEPENIKEPESDQKTSVEVIPAADNSDDCKRDSRIDSTTLYDLEEDVLDFETESIAGSEEDTLDLHDSDSDSLEKLMECIEKELSTPTQVNSKGNPKTLSRLKMKPNSESAKPPDPPANTKQKSSNILPKQSTPPGKPALSTRQKDPPKINHSAKPKSPTNVDNTKLDSPKPSIYEKLSPVRRRYSPNRASKQNSPLRIHSPRRSPLRKRSPSPRKRSITPHKRSLTPRKRSLSPRKRTASPRRRSPTPRKRSLTPRKRSPSPRKRSLTPRKRTPTPRKRSLSPRKRSLSPRKRSLTPRKRSLTPRKRSLTPRKRSHTPRKRSLSPRRRSLTPRKRSVTPRKRSLTPRKRTLSPRRRSITPRRLSPRRRSISPRRRRSISPRRRSISPRRRSPSLRRRSLSPWRRSPSLRRSPLPPRRRSPTPKKRSLTPRRRSLTPKKRAPSPRKRSLSPRRRSVSPRHNSPNIRKRPLSPNNSKRSDRGKRLSPLGRRQWMRTKVGSGSNRQNSKGSGSNNGANTANVTSSNASSSGGYINRTANSRNAKEDEKRARASSREARPREKASEEVKDDQVENNADSQSDKPLDPKLEARKRKFENNHLIAVGTVNKKIRLKSEQAHLGENSRSGVENNKDRESSPIQKSNRKRIILAEDNKAHQEENRESKLKETLTTRTASNLKRSGESKKTVEEEAPVKKKRSDEPVKEDQTKKGVDLRTELSRRRAERMKGASIDPMARIVQSALEGAVGKIKSKSRASPPSDQEAPPATEKKSSKPKGRRVHVLPAKSSKSEDKKNGAEDKNSGLSMHYRSSSPVRNSGRSILRRNQV